MESVQQRDFLAELSNAVASYLNVIAATAECLEQAFPETGSVYRQRIERMRARIAYHATPEAVKEGVDMMAWELKGYADLTHRILQKRSVEMTRGILALGELLETLVQHQESFCSRVRALARQTVDPEHAASLRELAREMSQEAAVVAARMRNQMKELDRRLAGTSSMDPATGLLDRREMERQIEARRLHGSTFSVLLFELNGPLSDELLRLAGSRLSAAFRHTEWIARWSEKELAVLFLGEPHIAEQRGAEAASAVSGNYTLASGAVVELRVKARLLEAENQPVGPAPAPGEAMPK